MTTRTTSRPDPTTRADIISLAVTAVGFVVALLLVAPALRVPPHVERVTIDNPHPWPAHVEANEENDRGWLGLGAVDRDHERTFRLVVDQGDRWVFRFSYAGTAAELQVSRAQLERDDWQVTVPADFARHLRQTGQGEAPTE